MKVLVIDLGGTKVKFLASGHKTARRFSSGPNLTPRRMVADVKRRAADWKYDAVSIGYPGVIKRGRGGGAKHLPKLPKGCRLGDNAQALLGGIFLWENAERKKKKGT